VNKFILIAAVLVLAGCGITRDIDVKVVAIQPEIFAPTDPRELSLESYSWTVVSSKLIHEEISRIVKEEGEFLPTLENINKLFMKIISSDKSLVVFAITPREYEIVALNAQEVARFIKQYQEIIRFYRKSTAKEEAND